MHTFRSLIGSSLLALACLAGSAHAAPVSYTFTASGAAGNGSGSFVFDDSTGSANLFGETEFALTGFSFSFGGSTVDLAGLDAGLRAVVFDGSRLLGLDAAKAGLFSLLPSQAGEDAFLVNGAGSSTSTLAFRLQPAQPLPEPGTGALVLLAAAALWAGRRGASGSR